MPIFYEFIMSIRGFDLYRKGDIGRYLLYGNGKCGISR